MDPEVEQTLQEMATLLTQLGDVGAQLTELLGGSQGDATPPDSTPVPAGSMSDRIRTAAGRTQ